MEEDYRPFEAIKIGLTSVETGQERFTRDGAYTPPPLSYWRCNLTALSQRFNLYFVATRDTVAVYQPTFPFQTLQRLPALLIPAALANPNARGYIDERVPHAVNHLIVGDLGQEEILVIATDSGNVAAYYTRAIEEAIRKDPYRLSTDARSDYVGVRAFFTHSVQESAWGVAIHSHARMIAVSANTPHHVSSDDPCAKVTVFAFALTATSPDSGTEDAAEDEDGPSIDDGVGELDWEEWTSMGIGAAAPPRDRNYKITLAGVEGHDHNIPCISFVNTGDDLHGDWLLSTDIGGELKIWQIWQGICQKSWDFAEKRMRSFFRRREGGWIVAALDPQSFQSAKTMDEFCGHSKAPQYHGHSHLESYDLTHVVRLRTPGNSHAHPLMYESTEDDNEGDDQRDYSDSWSNLDEATVEVSPSQNDPISFPVDVGERPADELGSFETSEVDLEPEMIGRASQHDSDPASAATSDTPDGPPGDTLHHEEMRDEHVDDEIDSDEDAEIGYPSASDEHLDDNDDGDHSSMSRRSTTSLSSLAHPTSPEIDVDVLSASDIESPLRRRQATEQKSHASTLIDRDSSVVRAHGAATAPTIPTLHCSASNLRLMMVPQADSPHLFCANVLKQALPPAFEASNHAHIDRLNMVLQIPELGIVIVATQLGRCAVCSLMKHEKTGTFGLRVDWILPTKKQEEKGLRPLGPLLGIAASPVQGRLQSRTSSHRPESGQSGVWGSDGIVDGVPTTFDPRVLVVETQDEEDDEEHKGHQTKRKRLSRHLPELEHSRTRTELRKWEVPASAEPWQAMDSSRRYRLMLTFLDMTVLTYELSRGLEKYDVAREEIISMLELLD